MERFPHTCTYDIVTNPGPPYQDDNGNWITPQPTTENKQFICRAIPDKANQFIKTPEGLILTGAWIVYAPQGMELPQQLTELKFFDADGNLWGKGKVNRAYSSQLNTKIWA